LGLILTSSDFDIFSFFGVACVALGVYGGIETIRNKPFTRIFGGPPKSQ